MDSGGGAWPKDLKIEQVVRDTAQQLGLPLPPPNLTLHSLLGIDPTTEAQLREYLATAYGSDPKRDALHPSAREDVELTEPIGRRVVALKCAAACDDICCSRRR